MGKPIEPYSDEELRHLVEVITDAWEKGIRYGGWSLARWILVAGYRRRPEPQPVRRGCCVGCDMMHDLDPTGLVADHAGGGLVSCVGSKLMPLRLVDVPEAVRADV